MGSSSSRPPETTKIGNIRHYHNRPSATGPSPLSLRWIIGLLQASCFSLVYLVAPFYLISATVLLCYYKIVASPMWLYYYSAPMLVSALLPSMASPFCLSCLQPMLDTYFESYEQIHECSPIDVIDQMINHGKNYIWAAQPHGVISYTAMLSAIVVPAEHRGKIRTAVADALLYTPILKHVMGIFGLTSASKASLLKTFQRQGLEGTLVLYVGGMAELFLSSHEKERLYLQKRKGFIKLSLHTGVDIIPIYLFGNTSILSVMTHGVLATLSRKLQVSLTYFWGKWNLPIPRNQCKLLYVSGQPLGIPHIPDPTQEDIDKYHALYCQQVQRLFDKYKEKVPEYKHKQLEIM